MAGEGRVKVKLEPGAPRTRHQAQKPKASKAKSKARKTGQVKAKVKKALKKTAKLPAKAKARAKGKPGKPKAEVEVKKEPRYPDGFKPTEHFRFQVAFINKVAPPGWKVCFGNLGTGFVGVCQSDKSRASCSSAAPEDRVDGLPADAVLVLFIAPPSCSMQTRNHKSMGGYKGCLDVEKRTLGWSSQRGDTQNRRIRAIIDHANSGGRVVAAIRGLTKTKGHFELLGEVNSIDGFQEADLLVESGDTVIAIKDGKSRFLHRAITPACMNQALKDGVPLRVVKFNGPSDGRLCTGCCWRPASCIIHFNHLDELGVAAYIGRDEGDGEEEAGEEGTVPPPPPQSVVIKQER